jgi:hypothetical protein
MELDVAINYSLKSFVKEPENMLSNDFIKNLYFDIILNDCDDENRLKIGKGHLQLIDLQAHHELYLLEKTQVCFYDIADSTSELIRVFNAIVLDKYLYNTFEFYCDYFKKSLSRILKRNMFSVNFIYLSILEIDEEYQSKKIGSFVINQIKKDFGYFGSFISILPYPLEFVAVPEDKDFNKEDFNLKQNKLYVFYKKNGFKRVDKSDIFICPLQ